MTATASDRRDRLRAMLADLKMPGALEAVDGVLAQVDSGAVTAGEAIELVLNAQIALRNNRRLQAAMRSSRLPAVKTLAQFDFTFQPSIKREQIESLHELKRFSNRPCTTWGGRGTSAHTDAGGPMRAYSMDLRERALLDSDAGMKAADVAAKYRVSGSWVRLLKQRRRDTGEVAPRVQRHGRRGMLEPHLHTLAALIAAHPDRTLAELKDALATPASVPTVWRAVRALGLTVKKNGPPVRTRSA